jgi:hypothetical protein
VVFDCSIETPDCLQIFRYLLEVQRIKPNAADRAGYSPIHHAVCLGMAVMLRVVGCKQARAAQAATGRTEIVQYLLDECYVPADGIGPEAISSPLLLAVQGGHIEVWAGAGQALSDAIRQGVASCVWF